jgi:hypothetical protein
MIDARLGSVAGPVIQASGRSEFEDGSGHSGSGQSNILSSLHTTTYLSRQRVSFPLLLGMIHPLIEYRNEATSGQSVLGWVTA